MGKFRGYLPWVSSLGAFRGYLSKPKLVTNRGIVEIHVTLLKIAEFCRTSGKALECTNHLPGSARVSVFKLRNDGSSLKISYEQVSY